MDPLRSDWRDRLRDVYSGPNRLGHVLQYGCTLEKSPIWCSSSAPTKPSHGSVRNYGFVVWMRGIVTLAAALALPDTFPYRDLLLFTAFCVVLGTLILQGLTLRPLMMALKFADDRVVEAEVRLARTEIARAALNIFD